MPRLGAWVYALALKLALPRDAFDRNGWQMIATFEDLVREARHSR
jgi:hypothetical protein